MAGCGGDVVNAFTWTLVVVAFLVADFYVGVKVGRMLKQDEPSDDLEPLPRRLNPRLPEQWQYSEDHLRDPATRDTPPPSDPAS